MEEMRRMMRPRIGGRNGLMDLMEGDGLNNGMRGIAVTRSSTLA
jgi:hypothetical protein